MTADLTDEQAIEDRWTKIMIDDANRIYWQFPNDVV